MIKWNEIKVVRIKSNYFIARFPYKGIIVAEKGRNSVEALDNLLDRINKAIKESNPDKILEDRRVFIKAKAGKME
jgi:hypothetical protein